MAHRESYSSQALNWLKANEASIRDEGTVITAKMIVRDLRLRSENAGSSIEAFLRSNSQRDPRGKTEVLQQLTSGKGILNEYALIGDLSAIRVHMTSHKPSVRRAETKPVDPDTFVINSVAELDAVLIAIGAYIGRYKGIIEMVDAANAAKGAS